MNSNVSDIQARLERLHQDYARQLPDKVGVIDRLWQQLLAAPDATTCQELIRLCHTLAGSGASYGFVQVTEHCRQIEQALQSLDDHADIPDALSQQINRHLNQLRELSRQAPDNRMDPDAKTADPSADRLIYILDEADHYAHELAGEIRNYGYTIELFDEPRLLQQQLQQQLPAAIVLTCSLAEADPAELSRFASLAQQASTLLITDNGDTAHRLQAVRNGIQAYFLKPANIIDLIDTLDHLTHEEPHTPCRILIVEDSQPAAEFYAAHLQQAGMEVQYITDPMQIMEAISGFSPELILMDLYMPKCSGKELSELIRQKESNLATPIVFLSAESDLEKQLDVIQHGDDFLTKPISAGHLVAAVRSRTRRFRELRALMLRDSLTGLYNHTALFDLFHRELQRASRHSDIVSYVMLDLDRFKQVNDNYGHGIGDQVIQSLSRLLRQRLRGSDYIGRYGGEEFAIVMPNTPADAACEVIDSIRVDFARLRQHTHDGEIYCTFSAGVIDSTLSDDAGNLARAADAALYRAKQAGRNRLMQADKADL
ncbi:diguanylate cyclase [Thiohalophilus sp.]|uniref:diguanylate cyclase n=1 Tax=Thiohalophilus sp. TaxID=3028392 RepID=UPI002ACD5BD1|nr:diguanylate cyclase [Thiohalophilus sp.]MDZ7803278.1 diguanylate cyclase [Thiohalophilus sp.]